MEISESISLVTGSARRVGRATAIALAERGSRVAIHYRSSGEDADATLATIRDIGVDADSFQADLTNRLERERLVREVQSRFGRVDILVNNASVFSPGTLEDSTSEMWDEQMEANAKAPYFMAQGVAPMMLRSGRGKIVNLADPAGELIWPSYFPYSVSKAALLGITRGLAKTLAPHVQVNAVAPGPVCFPDYYTESQKQFAVEKTLLKRVGSPDDVVRAVLFLVENDYITGEVIHVDGGRHAM
jgi:NAD(P)-dependent dehydrogenase (short-subunit alcohol dehydrogenase family)